MVKFNRSDVQDMLEPGDEVEVTVSGELTDTTPFEGIDAMVRDRMGCLCKAGRRGTDAETFFEPSF